MVTMTGEEHANWGYLWSNQMQWKHQFVAVSPGKLQVFSSEQRDHLERKIFLNGGTTVKIVDSTESGNGSLNSSSKLHFWRRISRRSSCTNQYLPEPEGAIVFIKTVQGKKMFLLVSNQHEAGVWKTAIEQRIVLPPKHKRAQSLLRALSLTSAPSKNKSVDEASRKTRPLALRWQVGNNQHPADALDTREDCTAFLKSRYSNTNAFEAAMTMIEQFNGFYQMGDCQLPNELRIEAWRGTLLSIVRNLRDQLLTRTSDLSEDHSESLWLACETWVMAAAHDKIMGACEQMYAADDRKLAQKLSKLRQLDPSILGVNADLKDIAFGDAIQVFGMINTCRSPLEKAVCLKKTINFVMDGIQASSSKENQLCTDDLLSLMLLLIAHAKLQHLQATACYMENFFQMRDDQQTGELRYHITNFVAACAYLSSPEIEELVSSVVISPASSSSSSSSPSSSNSSSSKGGGGRSRKEIDAAFATGTSESSPEFILAPTYL
ncbi:uncharacterized protein LOC112341688 [Selaginella moellendorffii]|uniref:uncharacterized protein LOC112341688 n=1 Tax=Selaginella moellendorffii TaxID=88036 RepID=UPI000D1D0627|nr:uncharacterized protein LOC112341688 [Selaginella moellendorffii]|eukprot:XP_024518036.1 uncharacterized protein LOC112341688 [Selaginella moellendorffii]